MRKNQNYLLRCGKSEVRLVILKRIWVCTSKYAKLHRIYLLNTGESDRGKIYQSFKDDLDSKIKTEPTMEPLNGSALIEDIPYYIDFKNINEDSYLYSFKEKIEEILEDNPPNVIGFSKKKGNDIKNFEENEGIKFIVGQSDNNLYFLHAPNNSIIKNKAVMTLSITKNSTVFKVPKGIQIPPAITAKFDCISNKLFVYDVNRFESMLALNENQKAKSKSVLKKFSNGEYTISVEKYRFIGLDNEEVYQKLSMSKRAIRRLSKYTPTEEEYSISQIKKAVDKLDKDLRVSFDDEAKTIKVTPNTAKTFVGIIHNIIVQRLISGEVEIAI